MMHGCAGLEGGTSVKVLVEQVHFLENATFSKRLSEVLIVSNYLRHAVSVQDSSGAILGCGRIETLSAVSATHRGKTTFSQFSPYLPAMLVDTSNLDVLQYNILDGVTCSSRATVFDPWSPPGKLVGTRKTPDQFPLGDLSNHPLELFSFLYEITLIGSATILGHVVRNDACTLAHPSFMCHTCCMIMYMDCMNILNVYICEGASCESIYLITYYLYHVQYCYIISYRVQNHKWTIPMYNYMHCMHVQLYASHNSCIYTGE